MLLTIRLVNHIWPKIIQIFVKQICLQIHEILQVNTRQNSSLAQPEGRRGGGGGGAIAPPPNNAFSEFCRYICKCVGTCKPTSMSFVPTNYPKYQQSIEKIAVLECENANNFYARSLRLLAYA